MAVTVMATPAFADNSAICGPGYGDRLLECVARDLDRDETSDQPGGVGHKAGECSRIEKLLANRQTRELIMQEPAGKRAVDWYAGNCPLRKSKG